MKEKYLFVYKGNSKKENKHTDPQFHLYNLMEPVASEMTYAVIMLLHKLKISIFVNAKFSVVSHIWNTF